jgi:hypothetical protein
MLKVGHGTNNPIEKFGLETSHPASDKWNIWGTDQAKDKEQ